MSRPKLPPFARELADARRHGLVPQTQSGWFHVCLGWGVSRLIPDKSAYPRVVLPLDAAIQDYDLRPLAGLDLKLVYSPGDEARMEEVADLLLAIRPRTLTAHSVPFAEGTWRTWQGRGETLLPGVRESWA